ncbi:dTDP-4-dehydrorhamnose reductase [Ilumatobacter fluminis]|uniref:dTDP-4-dehydrorhamnose reductase n=1 Tax=Ilumatobacter fluminis TaxID=467091 RepID=A0A4R7I218_9ACTN|nr:dTDP-4-dehydrorhamnose reductase [Ilumatobacter fluminis]TDT17495.1 dTDP-4-dehydrorhamnose reductase [Ilumatobacter fluminis]
MRILVTGAAGQLGHDLVATCVASGDDVHAVDRAALDVGDRDRVASVVADVGPDVVVNCAAWTAVDACESDPERAMRDNGDAVRWLREACDTAGAHLVQISTDYVFDGTSDRPYVETDETNPQSVYGRSKRAGEVVAGERSTIVRTSWVCGAAGGNMVKTVLRVSAERDTLSFVDDQRGCPTFTADLAPLVRHLAAERRSGIFHATNQGAVSWYEFVRDIVAAAGRDPEMVHPISTVDLDPPRPAPRPANSVLDNAALRDAGIPLLRPYHEPLAELVAQLVG